MTTTRDEVLRLLDDLDDEDLVWLADELRTRMQAEGRGQATATATLAGTPGAPGTSGAVVTDSPRRSPPSLRWPHLGPGAVGAAILLGWLVGAVGGPLLASAGVLIGLILGDRLDQRTAASEA